MSQEGKIYPVPEFHEPHELQEWYDIGADIRINMRLQFSRIRRLAEKATEGFLDFAVHKPNCLWYARQYDRDCRCGFVAVRDEMKRLGTEKVGEVE